jgi:hypothetical protein
MYRLAGLPVEPVEPVETGIISDFISYGQGANGPTGTTDYQISKTTSIFSRLI